VRDRSVRSRTRSPPGNVELPPVSSTRRPFRAPRRTEVRGRASVSADPVSGTMITSSSSPSVRTARMRPSSSVSYQRGPSSQSGPPNSASSVCSGPISPCTFTVYRFHQPLRSLMNVRLKSSTHSGCSTLSVVEPARIRVSPVSRSVRWSSVPSQGICGCSQPIQARRLPSGEKRGNATKCAPPASERIPVSSSAPVPSSSTATMSRVTVPSACVSRTAITSEPRMLMSPNRKPRPAGVSGTGVEPPSSSRYRRWSVNSTNTSARSAVTAHAPPPYSCTRLRAFHGAGSASPRALRTAYRPPSEGRPSSHHTSSPTQHPPCTGCPLSAMSRAVIGERQVP
jgi:hypothetical protein